MADQVGTLPDAMAEPRSALAEVPVFRAGDYAPKGTYDQACLDKLFENYEPEDVRQTKIKMADTASSRLRADKLSDLDVELYNQAIA